MREEELEIAIKVLLFHIEQIVQLISHRIIQIGGNCGQWRSGKKLNDPTLLQRNVHKRL